VRTDSARSDKGTPRRSIVSSIVEISMESDRNAWIKTCASSQNLSASSSFRRRSSFLVRPQGRSHSQVNPRSSQNRHTGRSPEHLVLRRRQWAQALKTDHLFAREVGCQCGVIEPFQRTPSRRFTHSSLRGCAEIVSLFCCGNILGTCTGRCSTFVRNYGGRLCIFVGFSNCAIGPFAVVCLIDRAEAE
jgi:hypothetical protein